MDPWAVLGVKPETSPASVRRAWRAAARRHHPDRGGDPGAFKGARAAWEILSSGSLTTPAAAQREAVQPEPQAWDRLRAVRRLIEVGDVDVETMDDGTTGFFGAGEVVWCSDEGLDWDGFVVRWSRLDDSIMESAAELLRCGSEV
jgi:hypothetical protein